MFTHRDVQRFIDAANFEGFTDNNLFFAFKSNSERQVLIKTSDVYEEKQIAAAIEIQRIWRGCRTRTLLFSIIQPTFSTESYLSTHYTSSSTFTELRASLNSSRLSARIHSSLSKAVSQIELNYHNYTEDALIAKKESKETLLTFQGFCACTIQSWWRHILSVRCATLQKPVNLTRNDEESKAARNHYDAANKIQKVWRKHIDVQVYKYYKQLINFQSKGDPRFMLRCINPKEASLLDEASGVHVRFRLGGVKFPPNVYYKIFTHINVADIGAFAPRNYTKASCKSVPGKFIHNKGFDSEENEDSDWYERVDNNGWRLVNDHVLKYVNTDAVVYETSNKTTSHFYEKHIRKQDLEVKKKRKKIAWMKKMYAAGMLKVKDQEDIEIKELVDVAAQSLFAAADEIGPECIDDWEVDELLQWTNGLNFDNYLQDWLSSGTTAKNMDLKGLSSRTDPLSALLEENK